MNELIIVHVLFVTADITPATAIGMTKSEVLNRVYLHNGHAALTTTPVWPCLSSHRASPPPTSITAACLSSGALLVFRIDVRLPAGSLGSKQVGRLSEHLLSEPTSPTSLLISTLVDLDNMWVRGCPRLQIAPRVDQSNIP